MSIPDHRDTGQAVDTSAKHLVAEFLLAGDARATVAAATLSDTKRWPEVLILARVWKVVPQLSARLYGLGLKLEARDTGELRREFLRAYAQSTSRATKAIAAIQALQKARIPVAAFKGIACMALLYDGPSHRTIGDGDLLILRKDLPEALRCLQARNFNRQGEESLAEYLNFVKNAPRFAGNQAVALYGEDESEVDLHWQIAGSGLSVQEVLDRSVHKNLLGSSIPVVDADDGLLLTVHHAIREDLGIESVCRDLLDILRWCGYLEQTGQLTAGAESAVRSRAQVAMLAVTSLLQGYDDTTAAARMAEQLTALASSAQRRSAARLMGLFHYQMEHGRMGKDVFYLVHSRPWWQIAKGLLNDSSGYRRSMETLEIQLKEKQPFLKRLAELARATPDLRGLRLARELARIKYGANKRP